LRLRYSSGDISDCCPATKKATKLRTAIKPATLYWATAIFRTVAGERPEDTVEVVMGNGDGATSYILYLAEVTAFAVGPFVDESDAIDCTVNV